VKKIIIPICLLAGLLFASCMEDKDTREWREANEAFMDAIADSTGVYPLEHRDEILTAETGAKFESTPKTGVYYKVITSGNGPRPVIGQTVKVNYTGTFYDGSQFDAGLAEFDVYYSSLIEGFYYALQRMKVGDRWIVYIPYYLGYGATTYYYSTPSIPAYSALVFDMELRSIVE